jgi:hypothetical protein
MAAQTRWNLMVSRETDNSLRQFLAEQGRARKGELSRFVEEAVRARIFETAVAEAKAKNRGRSLEEIQQAVDEALEWARRR